MPLKIKPKDQCRWDELSLGEVMLRFDPGDHRIATTRKFEVFEGGGEYQLGRRVSRRLYEFSGNIGAHLHGFSGRGTRIEELISEPLQNQIS